MSFHMAKRRDLTRRIILNMRSITNTTRPQKSNLTSILESECRVGPPFTSNQSDPVLKCTIETVQLTGRTLRRATANPTTATE